MLECMEQTPLQSAPNKFGPQPVGYVIFYFTTDYFEEDGFFIVSVDSLILRKTRKIRRIYIIVVVYRNFRFNFFCE